MRGVALIGAGIIARVHAEAPQSLPRVRVAAVVDLLNAAAPGCVRALPSDTEQMPLSVIEAMASGLPVAATDVCDVAAMVAAGNQAFVIPVEDAAMATAWCALIDGVTAL
ncbi:MAG TPA: glycosyltransferase family 4 protein [Acetobacteraceae bacterium]|jgi:glycosyltransferase involved in cell wall biosynthesis